MSMIQALDSLRSACRWTAGVCTLVLALAPALLQAQGDMPPVVSYQGFLTSPAGAPLSGTFSLDFRLYTSAQAVQPLWQEIHPAVEIVEGVFSVFLGSITPLLANPGVLEFDRPYFLGVAIDGAPELTPRLALSSLPVVALAKGSLTGVTVDCGAGESINDAINAAPVGRRLTVTITGACTENVVIERNFVTLDGGGAATLTGITPNPHPGNAVVYLDGARSIEIDGLGIAGAAGDTTGMHGVFLSMISSARIREGSVVENHNGNGILMEARSQLDLINSTVRNNALIGVYARNGSNVGFASAQVTGNLRAGVFLHRQSSGTFNATSIEGNGDQVEELGFCKCALYLDEGSQAIILDNNTFRSAAQNAFIGAAMAVYRGSSLRFQGDGTLVDNTVFDAANRDPFARASNVGLALDVEIDSAVRLQGGTTTIRGWVVVLDLTSVDLRQVSMQGHVSVGGPYGNFRLQDRSGVSDRVSIMGDIIMAGGELAINTSASRAALIDGNVDCRGNGSPNNNVKFSDPDDGYINCFGIATDLEASITESADPISSGGSVVYDLTIDNTKRSPAVEALDVTIAFLVNSLESFEITAADTASSLSPGNCNIEDAGTDIGSGFEGRVTCLFESIRLTSGLAQVTVSSVLSDLDVDMLSIVSNGDEDSGNDRALEITTVQ